MHISEADKQVARHLADTAQTAVAVFFGATTVEIDHDYWADVAAFVKREDRLRAIWEQPVTVGGD